MGAFYVCSLEDVEEKRNDANTSAVSKLTTVPAPGFTPPITMKQCEEIMERLEESAQQRNETHEQNGSTGQDSAPGARKQTHQSRRVYENREIQINVMHACRPWQRATRCGARQEWMVLCGGMDTSFINELFEDKSSDVSNEEFMLSMVTDDQERDDVSTTASDGNVSPTW